MMFQFDQSEEDQQYLIGEVNPLDPEIVTAKNALLLSLRFHAQFSLPLHEVIDTLAIFTFHQWRKFDPASAVAEQLDSATTALEENVYFVGCEMGTLGDPDAPLDPAIASAKDALLLSLHYYNQFSGLPLYEVIDVLATFTFQQSQKFDKTSDVAKRLDRAAGALEEAYYAAWEVSA
ncbi:MAG: hypothetical protein KME18_09335 [Phormidium tanganyikae FI6-MK23]|jgi:hypothetical protein|nr:hypothetical protein [Phormidium tanganyikae FI6-MK23]